MAHRSFRDRAGRRWDVWTVVPTKVERRLADAPVDVERREISEPRVRLGPAMAQGWLCFETKGEKRRLAPFPEDWHGQSEEGLEGLLAQAELVPQRPRV